MNLKIYLAVLMTVWLSLPTLAQNPGVEPRADRILHDMSDYLGSLRSFSFHVDTTEDKEISGRWVEHDASADIFVRRPDGLRVIKESGKGKVSAYFNGESFSLFNSDKGMYATRPVSGSITNLLDTAHEKLGMTLPVADVLFPDSYQVLMADVRSGFYVGQRSILGVRCHHLSFILESGLEWQIWIEEGKMRVPRKLVIRHANEPGVPRFSAVFSEWDSTTPLAPDLFEFFPPDGAVEIEILPRKGDQ